MIAPEGIISGVPTTQPHRDAWVEIDLGALDYNVRAYRDKLDPDTQLLAVVKADAYGHGAERVAFAALMAGASHFGVATVEEGVQLREAQIVAPIHLLSEPPIRDAERLLDAQIIPTITRLEFAQALSVAATARGEIAQVQLAINTGMNRIGFRPEDALNAARTIVALPGLELEGLFTHFATADIAGDWEARRAAQAFDHVVELLHDEGIKPLVHCSNTAAITLMPEVHHDMVRLGIGMYGLHPSTATRGTIDLAPVMSVKARPSFIKKINLGEGVSYGLTWEAPGPVTIVTLPLGYADGIPRVASNKMEVLIHGRRCQQVGRVCMDQFMVAVPRDITVSYGDEVVIVGEQGDECITLDELAAHAGTINYESACVLGALRLERIYI